MGHPPILLLSNDYQEMRNHLKCRFFMLREVLRWRSTVGARILSNPAIVRTQDHVSASKTCIIQVSISSRGGWPELSRPLRSERSNLVAFNQRDSYTLPTHKTTEAQMAPDAPSPANKAKHVETRSKSLRISFRLFISFCSVNRMAALCTL
jgi:hypothetical protein